MLYFFAAFSIVFHVWAFVMESILFMRPAVYRVFGLRSLEEAKTVKLIAFNQGFYNLFLALVLLAGLYLIHDATQIILGTGLAIGAAFCMTGAGMILIISKPDAWYAGLIQAIPPLIVILTLL